MTPISKSEKVVGLSASRPGSNLEPGPLRSDSGPNGSKFEEKWDENGQILLQLCTRNFKENNTHLIFVENAS